MRRRPAPAGRAGRIILAVLVTAASLDWAAAGHSTAAAPAELISVNPANGSPLSSADVIPSVSGDGNIVVFTAVPPFSALAVGNVQVVVRNRSANTTTVVPPYFRVDRTTNGVVSRDGCHVAFWGYYTGLILFPIVLPAQWEIFTWDRCTAGATPVYVSNAHGVLPNSTDTPGPLAISADGRYVAYIATSATLGAVAARINTSPTITEDQLEDGFFNGNSIDISDDGSLVAVGGQNTISDLTRNVVEVWAPPCVLVGEFSWNCNVDMISAGTTTQNSAEVNRNPSLSADGRYIAFTSNTVSGGGTALTRRQVYVRDRVAGATKIVSTAAGQLMAGDLDDPEITPDGTQVALVQATTGVTGKPVSEVFVARSSSGFFDTAAFDLISYGVSGSPTSTDSVQPSLSSNGRYVAFASAANAELSGTTLPAGTEVWMRQRPIALDITPGLDFGTIDPGTTSAPKTATVTNTSGVAINIGAVIPPAAPFSITSNTCGGSLPAGASCSITLVFSPTAPGSASSSVTVTGDGLSVSASLVGVGRNNLTPGFLTIKPTAANYGSGPLGTVIAPKKFTVTNPGQTAVPLAGADLSGDGRDQFTITSNGCTGTLAPAASCIVQVGATITREGSLSATLAVIGTGGQTAQATLRIAAVFTPTLKMNPGVVAPGEVTSAVGAGFPPNIDVQLAFAGEAPFATVHTLDDGSLHYDLLLLPHGIRIGGTQIVAVDQPPDFSGVHAPLLIQLATSRPSGFTNPQFTSGVRALITRGG